MPHGLTPFSQDQVDLMLNSSQRWQPQGYLGRKNVLKFLQKVSDSVRQGQVISFPMCMRVYLLALPW
jgi:hypothetical protein